MMPAGAPPWFRLAAQSLTETVLKNYDVASQALKELVDEHSSEVLPEVMMAWIDTLLTRNPPPGTFGGFAFVGEHDRQLNTVDDVPPAVAWAGRLIVARANADEQQLRALIDSVPTDADWARNVNALLTTVAANLRALGWADELRAADPS